MGVRESDHWSPKAQQPLRRRGPCSARRESSAAAAHHGSLETTDRSIAKYSRARPNSSGPFLPQNGVRPVIGGRAETCPFAARRAGNPSRFTGSAALGALLPMCVTHVRAAEPDPHRSDQRTRQEGEPGMSQSEPSDSNTPPTPRDLLWALPLALPWAAMLMFLGAMTRWCFGCVQQRPHRARPANPALTALFFAASALALLPLSLVPWARRSIRLPVAAAVATIWFAYLLWA